MRARDVARKAAPAVGAVVCFALALVLGLIATDVAAWRSALPADDVRYRADPEHGSLWKPATRVPWLHADDLLGVGDDVEFREAVRALRIARLDEAIVSDPETAVRRSVAQARLQAIATRDGDPARQSRAAGLIGVLGFVRMTTEAQDRAEVLQMVLATLRSAIELDPENDEAKHNLELALQRSRGFDPAEAGGGKKAAPGGAGQRGAGTGEPGSGY